MSDDESENDLFPNQVLNFQNNGTMISAKGPNINTNISSMSFRNTTSSTMNVPRNFERPRYAHSVNDQLNMTSSTLNVPWNLDRPQYAQSVYDDRSVKSYSRSMYNGRAVSPMSIRSTDTISARDIALALETTKFNMLDLKRIKDLCNKRLKKHMRRRVEKKRNVRKFLKGYRRRSGGGGDSGVQASDSSISSDDCRSLRSSRTVFQENMSSSRSTRTDLSYYPNKMKQNIMTRDCLDNFRPNTFKSGVPTVARSIENLSNQRQSVITGTQQERFKSGYLLPSHRFEQSVGSKSILESSTRLQSINEGRALDKRTEVENHTIDPIQRHRMPNIDSEEEEIFNSNKTVAARITSSNKRKRSHSSERDSSDSDQKRNKPSSPHRRPKTPKPQPSTSKQEPNDFVFAKPQLPMKKPTLVKNVQTMNKPPKNLEKSMEPCKNMVTNVPNKSKNQPTERVIASSERCEEKLLANSKHCEEQIIASSTKLEEKFNSHSKPNTLQVPSEKNALSHPQENEPCPSFETTQQSTTDISMRPSFIKRKLFTQKVDDTEKNASSDNLATDSPQTNIYSKIQKEKNKARKLVTSQSCLYRDLGDESNLLDLIHKIVPADRMNVTSATNRSELVPKNKSKPANSEKWDVSTVLTTCNDEELSDTYTDEEIFNATKQDKPSEVNKMSDCVIVIEPICKKMTEDLTNINKAKNFKVPSAIISDKPKNYKMPANMQSNIKDLRVVANVEKKAKNQKELANSNKIKNKLASIEDENKENTALMGEINKKPNATKAIIDVDNSPISENNKPEGNDVAKRCIQKCVKSFWDIDSESDFEFTPHKKWEPLKLNAADSKNTQVTASNLSTSIKLIGNNPKNVINVQKNLSSNMNKTLVEKAKATPTKFLNNNVNNEQKLTNKVKTDETTMKNVKNSRIDTCVEKTKVLTTKTIKSVCDVHNKKNNEKSDQTTKNNTSLVKNNKVVVAKINSTKVLGKNMAEKQKLSDKKIANNTKSNINANKASNTTSETKQKSSNSPKASDKSTLKNTKLKVNKNNNTITANNRSINLNNTLRIRPQRKPKVKKCCEEPEKIDQSMNDTLYKSLRTRQVKLSISDGDKTIIGNDLSLTFTPPPTKRPKRTTASRKPRDSDVSFTLATDRTLNKCTRGSRSNREIEALQMNSSFFFRNTKPSPLNKKGQLENLGINRPTRLNRTRLR